MTAVATITPKAPLVAGDKATAIVPSTIEQVWRFAELVSKSGMAPKGMEQPEKITVAILHGLEIGLTPMNALQSIAVVNGKPTIYGDGAIGLARASGLLEWMKETIEGEGDKMKAVCIVKRRGEPEPVRVEFSVTDAKAAGLWGKKTSTGQPTPWVTYPKRMLGFRARGFALRDTFADALKGLAIREEVEDYEMKDVTPQKPRDDGPPMIAPFDAIDEPTTNATIITLEDIEARLSDIADPQDLERCWNDEISDRVPIEMQPDALAIYRKHELRLGID